MSLMRTLAKVAMGVAMARGASSVMQGSRGRRSRRGGGLLGGLVGGGMGGMGGAGAGGLAAMLGPVLAGRHAGSPGLGGMLEGLGGARRPPARTGGGMGGGMGGGGGLDGLLGGLLGGGAAGGLMGQMASRADRPSGQPQMGFGEALNASFDDERDPPPVTPEQEAAAGLMLRAMVQAARADGVIDAEERERLMGHLQDLDPEERRFVEEEMQAPVDPEGLARQVPKGLEPQIYAMSLMAIDLDHPAEVDYLRRLARALGLSDAEVELAHDEVGAPALDEV